MDDRVEAARAWIEAHADEVVTLGSLARRLGVSPFHLQRQFSQRFGVSPSAYGRAVRVGRFKVALKAGAPVADATYEAGFGSSRAAYEVSDKALGMSPAAYRAGGRGVEVRFATTRSAHGRVLVAETGRGVCAVFLGADDTELEALLEDEFPAAIRTRVAAGDLCHCSAVVGVIAGEVTELPPVDVCGTPFQARVWRALQAIPRGATRSYAQVAKAVGKPAAVRAVANACAANRVAMLVPCHRVVGSNGASGGYRWGAARKRALLLEERLPRGEGE
jgi:AraC family transcriptional regulator of adaptative response/methylated-DNA-[protein]-cysteine methyltransferase